MRQELGSFWFTETFEQRAHVNSMFHSETGEIMKLSLEQ